MSEVKVNKVSPRSGTTVTIGDSGDTINIVGTLQNNGAALSGDISSVVAGTGLSGGATSGVATLNIEAAQPTITSLGTLSSATISGDVTVDTSTLKVDSSNDRVGIGTASPSSLLHIFSSEPTLIIQDGGAYSVNATPSISLRDGSGAMGSINYSSGGIFRINQAKNDHLTFSTNNTERFRIRSDGIGCFGTTSASGVAGTGVSIRSGVVGSSGVAALNLAGSGADFFAVRFASSGFQIADIVSSSVDHLSIRNSSDETTLATFNDGTGFIKKDLGVGTTSPEAIIHGYTSNSSVTPNANADELFVESSGNSGITIGSGTTGAGILAFGDSDDNDRGEVAYLHDVDALRFTTAASERVRIDSSGNVGIGTSSPQNKLHLDIGTDNTGIRVNSTDTTTGIALADNGGSAVMQTTSSGAFRVLVGGDANTPGDNSYEGMRIHNDGEVDINVDNSGTSVKALHVLPYGTSTGMYDGVQIATNSNRSFMGLFRQTTSASSHIIFYNTNGNIGSIQTSGTSTSFNTSSDHRLKENVNYDFDATSRLKELKPARFNFIKEADKTLDGFLAHEVQSIVPEAVHGTYNETETKQKVVVNSDDLVIAENIEQADWETGKIADDNGNTKYPTDSTWEATKVIPVYQGIDQAKLVPVLTKALQEAITKIEELETRITQLENA